MRKKRWLRRSTIWLRWMSDMTKTGQKRRAVMVVK